MSTTLYKSYYIIDTIQGLLALRALIAQGLMTPPLMIVGDIKSHTTIMWRFKANILLKEGRLKVMRHMMIKAAATMPRHHTPAKVNNNMKKATVKIMKTSSLSKTVCANDNKKSKLKLDKSKSASKNKQGEGKPMWSKQTMRGK